MKTEIAKHDYECDLCACKIRKNDSYLTENLWVNDSLKIWREHINTDECESAIGREIDKKITGKN